MHICYKNLQFLLKHILNECPWERAWKISILHSWSECVCITDDEKRKYTGTHSNNTALGGSIQEFIHTIQLCYVLYIKLFFFVLEFSFIVYWSIGVYKNLLLKIFPSHTKKRLQHWQMWYSDTINSLESRFLCRMGTRDIPGLGEKLNLASKPFCSGNIEWKRKTENMELNIGE